MKQDLTILVCCHKPDYFYAGEGYLPIHVGKAISNVDLKIQGDDTGDNISAKNPNYCELTAHYWYWKNCLHSKYVGLNHYRRYFDFGSAACKTLKFSPEQLNENPPQPFDIDQIFSSYDVVLAKPIVYKRSLEADYAHFHRADDLRVLREVIEELTPDYLEAYNHIMSGNKLSPCNMFITRSETFAHYSEWCFKILSEVEKRIEISSCPQQARVFGYMSERLLNVYALRHGLKVKHLPIIKIVERAKKRYWIIDSYKDLKNNITFSLGRLLGRK